MKRINQKDLEALVSHINKMTSSPRQPWSKINGKCIANVGSFHLSWAYGGVTLHRMQNEGGGVTDVLHTGYVTKRECYAALRAFIQGVEL